MTSLVFVLPNIVLTMEQFIYFLPLRHHWTWQLGLKHYLKMPKLEIAKMPALDDMFTNDSHLKFAIDKIILLLFLKWDYSVNHRKKTQKSR